MLFYGKFFYNSTDVRISPYPRYMMPLEGSIEYPRAIHAFTHKTVVPDSYTWKDALARCKGRLPYSWTYISETLAKTVKWEPFALLAEERGVLTMEFALEA